MELLLIDARYQPLFEQFGWSTGADALRRFNPAGTTGSKKVVISAQVIASATKGPLTVFCKQYRFRRPSWRFWLRPSKARREFENYQTFERLGIACAERIACGESRDWLGRLQHAFILTRAVANIGTLLEFVQKQHPARSNAESRNVRNMLVNQLAAMIRRIHEAGFFHGDLYWRNILVECAPGQQPKLWWLDCPRGRFDQHTRSSYRRRLKDLASLDLGAIKLCSATERMRFMRKYLGLDKLDPPAKKFVRRVIKYGMKRWPDPGR